MMGGGGGVMLDMVNKVRENLARLPSRQTRNSKFMEKKRPKHTYKQSAQKLVFKDISENELNDVISKIKINAKKEKRKQMLIILPLTLLITILILISIFWVLGQFFEWYLSGGREYLKPWR